MRYQEKDLEDWLHLHPARVGITRWIARQLVLVNGKLDLLGIDTSGALVIVEVKLRSPELKLYEAVMQTVSYADDIRHIIEADCLPAYEIRRAVVADTYYPMRLKQGALALGVDLWTMTHDEDGEWDIENSSITVTEDGNAEVWSYRYYWGNAAKRLRGIL